MKFSVSSGELLQHLQTVAKVINPKATTMVPVLANILFELRGNTLTLTAADMSNRLTTSLEVNNSGGDGSFIVPERLIEGIKELPDQPVTFEVNEKDGYKSKVTFSNGHYDILVASADPYPDTIALSDNASEVTLSAESMINGIATARVAASTDERRPIMTGVLMDFHEDRLVYVASDGRILVRYTDHNIKGMKPAQLCIPGAVCKLLTSSLLPKEKGQVVLRYDGKYMQLVLSSYVMTILLLDGKYPAYNSVIPNTSPYTVTVNKDAYYFSTKRVALFANKASKLVLHEFSGGQLTLRASDLDFSISGQEVIPCQINDASAQIRIGFDSEMLRQILEGLTCDELSLSLSDQTRAGVIRPTTTSEGVDILCLIIPLKLIGH